MRQSSLSIKTRKEAPKGEEATNAELLIRGGFIHKEMAGVYTLLPLGWKVVRNIEQVIREEMDKVGGHELHLTALQSKDIWEKSERWNDEVLDVWFKTELASGGEVGLGATHEEPLTNLLTEHISSYRDLPALFYQIQTKFRNELRAKSGMLRGREFRMKDLYSFSKSREEHEEIYEKMKQAYIRVFERLGVGDSTFVTFASGGSFSEFSHEFQLVTEAGEDTIFLDREKGIAVNDEVYTDEVLATLELDKIKLEKVRATEVGNIFTLGTKFSVPLGLNFKNEQGESQPVLMGSYGIGSTRLMGALVEHFAQDGKMVWPEEVTPFQMHLITLGDDESVREESEKIYERCVQNEVKVLFDDRDKSPGEKFADADLIGIPVRVIVGSKGLAEGKVERVDRRTGTVEQIAKDDIGCV